MSLSNGIEKLGDIDVMKYHSTMKKSKTIVILNNMDEFHKENIE